MAPLPSREPLPINHECRKNCLRQSLRQSGIATLAIHGLLSGYSITLAFENSQTTEPTKRTSGAEIRKRTDASAESDRRASQTHFEKLRTQSPSDGLSDIKKSPPTEPAFESASDSNASQAKSPKQEPRQVAPQSFYGEVLHEGPCTPCELEWQISEETTFEPWVRSTPVAPNTQSNTQSSKSPAIKTPQNPPPQNKTNASDRESTTKPSLPSSNTKAPQTTIWKHLDRGPLTGLTKTEPIALATGVDFATFRQAAPEASAIGLGNSTFSSGYPLTIGTIRGLVAQEIKSVEPTVKPIVVAKITLLPPPKITAIPASEKKRESNALANGLVSFKGSSNSSEANVRTAAKRAFSTSSSSERIDNTSHQQDDQRKQLASKSQLTAVPRYTSVTQSNSIATKDLEPLRVGSLGSYSSTSADYASYYEPEEPALLDQEALASPSLSDSTSVSNNDVQQAAFQGPGGGFGLPPSMGNAATMQPSIPPPVVTAPVYPTSPTYQQPPANSSIYPAPQVMPGNSMPSTSPGFSPQAGYGLPNYQNRGTTIVSGEPFVTAAPRQFDACYMVEPTYANTNGCGSPPMANTLPYSGIPGTVVPPTMMPNQVPQGLYSNSSSGFRPLFGFGQDANNVQLGRGLWGQPKAYVPGQCFRNSLRYITP